jgi:hypothetical protein
MLATLADVRELFHRLPAEYRAKETWQRVAKITAAAACRNCRRKTSPLL